MDVTCGWFKSYSQASISGIHPSINIYIFMCLAICFYYTSNLILLIWDYFFKCTIKSITSYYCYYHHFCLFSIFVKLFICVFFIAFCSVCFVLFCFFQLDIVFLFPMSTYFCFLHGFFGNMFLTSFWSCMKL